MRNYDYEKAAKIISERKPKTASLGMAEDWSWTAETIYEGGEFKMDLATKPEIAGIRGSYWATPSLHLEMEDGAEVMIECHDNGERREREGFAEMLLSNMGPISGPCQERINSVPRET